MSPAQGLWPSRARIFTPLWARIIVPSRVLTLVSSWTRNIVPSRIWNLMPSLARNSGLLNFSGGFPQPWFLESFLLPWLPSRNFDCCGHLRSIHCCYLRGDFLFSQWIYQHNRGVILLMTMGTTHRAIVLEDGNSTQPCLNPYGLWIQAYTKPCRCFIWIMDLSFWQRIWTLNKRLEVSFNQPVRIFTKSTWKCFMKIWGFIRTERRSIQFLD